MKRMHFSRKNCLCCLLNVKRVRECSIISNRLWTWVIRLGILHCNNWLAEFVSVLISFRFFSAYLNLPPFATNVTSVFLSLCYFLLLVVICFHFQSTCPWYGSQLARPRFASYGVASHGVLHPMAFCLGRCIRAFYADTFFFCICESKRIARFFQFKWSTYRITLCRLICAILAGPPGGKSHAHERYTLFHQFRAEDPRLRGHRAQHSSEAIRRDIVRTRPASR